MVDEGGEDVHMYVLPKSHPSRRRGSPGYTRVYQPSLPRRTSRDICEEASSLAQNPEVFLDPVFAYEAGCEGFEVNGTRMRKIVGLKHFRRTVGMRWSWLGVETLDVPEEYWEALCIVAVSIDGSERVVAVWC